MNPVRDSPNERDIQELLNVGYRLNLVVHRLHKQREAESRPKAYSKGHEKYFHRIRPYRIFVRYNILDRMKMLGLQLLRYPHLVQSPV